MSHVRWCLDPVGLMLPLLLLGAADVAAAPKRTSATVTAPKASPLASAAPADTSAVPGTARVTYLSGGTIYLNAGSLDGLKVGQTLEIERGGARVATLRVDFLASHRAACSAVSGDAAAVVDLIRFEPAKIEVARSSGAAPGTEASPAASRRRRGNWFRRNGLRGRVGARLLTVRDLQSEGGGFRQPSIDARLEGTRVGGSDLDLSIDLRTRRTYRTDADATDLSLTRVYRLGVAHQGAGSRLRISAGRLTNANLSSVNLFDGVLTEYLGSRMATGIFAGSQPGTRDWDYSREVMEYGGYVRFQNESSAPRRWTLTGGGVTSIRQGESNRDYIFLRGQWNDARTFGFVSQELDINRGWRRELESRSISWTSTLLSLQYRPSERFTLTGGYDNRRSIRIYEDRETPESEFDANHRQGWSAGATVYPVRNLSLTGDRRQNGSGSERSDASTGSWRATRIPLFRCDAGGRHTRYSNPLSMGWLHAWTLSGGLGSSRRLEAHAGLRDESARDAGATRTMTRWYGINLDVGVARSIYLLLSGERTRGDLEKNDQYYLSLSYQL